MRAQPRPLEGITAAFITLRYGGFGFKTLLSMHALKCVMLSLVCDMGNLKPSKRSRWAALFLAYSAVTAATAQSVHFHHTIIAIK